MAELTINSFGNQYAKFLLESEDAISYVAYCMMVADLKWNPDGGMTQKSWRIQHGRYGIQKFIKQLRNKTKKNKEHATMDLIEWGGASYENAVEPLLRNENMERFEKDLDSYGLTAREKQVLLDRIDGRSLTDMAKELSVTRQAVSQNYRKAIEKVRNGRGYNS